MITISYVLISHIVFPFDFVRSDIKNGSVRIIIFCLDNQAFNMPYGKIIKIYLDFNSILIAYIYPSFDGDVSTQASAVYIYKSCNVE